MKTKLIPCAPCGGTGRVFNNCLVKCPNCNGKDSHKEIKPATPKPKQNSLF